MEKVTVYIQNNASKNTAVHLGIHERRLLVAALGAEDTLPLLRW